MINIRLFGLCCGICLSTSLQAETVRVYAAASLNEALQAVSTAYRNQFPNTQIKPVFASSALLAKQIEAGAKSDLYFSADLEWMDYLVAKKRINATQVHPVLSNRLVVIGSNNLKIYFQVRPQFNFAQAFKGKLCTAQLQSVPAGKYAQQSLMYFNWLTALQGRIVQTQDVRAALVLVERGECELGIVYKTDALLSNKVKIIGTFPANSHQAIVYPMALTKQGEHLPEAVQFAAFIRSSPQAKSIFKQYGFTVFL